MDARIFDSGSQKWIRFTPFGDVQFVSDRSQASQIDSRQLESLIRNFELDYLRNSLVLQPDEPGAAGVGP